MRKASSNLKAARAAKAKLSRALGAYPHVNGVGITRLGDGYGLKVNLDRTEGVDVPDHVDGVPVQVERVGRITKR